MLSIRKYKCLKCGHKFVHTAGGLILRPFIPKCPRCGSKITVAWEHLG